MKRKCGFQDQIRLGKLALATGKCLSLSSPEASQRGCIGTIEKTNLNQIYHSHGGML